MPSPENQIQDRYDQMADVTKCRRCNGSGEIAISSTTGRFVAPGPVPDDAKGVIGSTCDICCGMGYVED
jgi:DnaJ-class molecular chaperone